MRNRYAKRTVPFGSYCSFLLIIGLNSVRQGKKVKKVIRRLLCQCFKVNTPEFCEEPRRIRDKRVLKLIKSFLLSGVEIRTKIPAKQGRGAYKAKIIKQIETTNCGVPQGGPLSPLLANIAEYIRGWMGYYRLSEYYLPIEGIDSWLRRRIRMCYLKMWGRMKTIVGKLLGLGVSVPEAVGLGRSRKKWWGRSKNPVINKALSDKYLVNQGLISIKDLWVQFHYPK